MGSTTIKIQLFEPKKNRELSKAVATVEFGLGWRTEISCANASGSH
jgi:hypothetical protein